MSRITVAFAATTTAALVLSGGAAVAGTKAAKDRSRDAAPVADITRVVVQNSVKHLTIKVKLSKPAAGRTHLVATLTPAGQPEVPVEEPTTEVPDLEVPDVEVPVEAGAAATYVVRTVSAPAKTKGPGAGKGRGKGKAKATRVARGKTSGVLELVPADGSAPVAVTCQRLKVTLSSGRNGQALLRVPQACFGTDAGDWVVAVTTETAGGDVIDETRPLAVPQG
ncbi:hypothetical protein [Nocardioides pacificus]